MNENEVSEQMKENVFAAFQSLSKAEQIRKITLAGNAEFVIRAFQTYDQSSEVGKNVGMFLEALTRYIGPDERGIAVTPPSPPV